MANKKKAAAKVMKLMGVRFSDEDLDEIARAAAIERRPTSTFVRIAAVDAARALNAQKR